MVGADDLDLDALCIGTEILDRHPGSDHRTFARKIGTDARAVVEDADLDGGGSTVGGQPARSASVKGWKNRRRSGQFCRLSSRPLDQRSGS
jgi:hypothetical protein